MATVKKLFVFITCLLSGLGVLFSIASITTENWVHTDKVVYNNNYTDIFQTVKYGLFQGTLNLVLGVRSSTQLTITCLAKENVCAYLCAETTEARYTLLKDLYNNKAGIDQVNCPSVFLKNRYHNKPISEVLRVENTDDTSNRKFINCGVWVSTILFLVISMLFGLISSGLSMYNTIYNPVEVFLSVYGIYLYNAIALFSLIIAMLLWGVMYNKSIYHDIAIFYTLYGQMTSDKTAQLGYSYWLNICSLSLYVCSICVLYVRQYLISKDPGQKIVQRDDDGDPVIYLY